MVREGDCLEEDGVIASCNHFMEEKYEEIYASLYAHLQRRRQNDPGFTVDDVRGFLNDAYVRTGTHGVFNGSLFDPTESATIAAYEVTLAEWVAELAAEK